MKTRIEIENVVSAMALQIRAVLGNKLTSVILFGSFARGDYMEGSDIDVMVIVDMTQEQIINCRDEIADIAFEIGWENGILISPIVQSAEIFSKYKDVSGFFKNVITEGVYISA